MKTQLRIVSGTLRNRKLTCLVSKDLRPTPERVREALFSILGNAVPDRPFFDVFAGTGIVGMEALSRGASFATFVERDFGLLAEIESHLKGFDLGAKSRLARSDVYRWIGRWKPPSEPVTVFLSPPFADLTAKADNMLRLIEVLLEKMPPQSVLVLQSESAPFLKELPRLEEWDSRTYGRNHLMFWVQPEPTPDSGEDETIDEELTQSE